MAASSPSPNRGTLRQIIQFFPFSYRLLYIVALICSAGAGAILPVMTLVFGQFVTIFTDFALGKVSDDEMLRHISHYTLYFVYLFVAKFVLSYLSMSIYTIVSVNVTASIQQHYLQNVLSQSISYHDTKLQSGAVSEALGNHATSFRSGLSDKMGLTVQNSATVIVAFAVAISSVWNLALATAAVVPASVLVIGALSVFDEKQQSQVNAFKEQASSLAHEVLSSIKTARSLNAANKLYKRYELLLKSAASTGWTKATAFGTVVGTYMFMLYAAYSLAFWYGIRLYAGGNVSNPGKVITTLFSIMIGLNAFSQLAGYLGGFRGIFTAARELLNLTDAVNKDAAADETSIFEASGKDIQLRDVSFHYPARPNIPVLNSLSLTFPAGKFTALIGQSGCGKSTILALLLRWYDAESGCVELGGQNLADIDVRALRATIGLVQQEPRLFSGTITENIEYGLIGTPFDHSSPSERKQMVVTACTIANAHDFIENLPDGYNTFIGDRGTQLSGGQKQRLAIARAIVKNPAILILDEATSALDSSSEAAIQAAIDKASQGRTVISVAHRLSTISQADKIIGLHKGSVVEDGTHATLMEKEDGLYKRLWRAQYDGTEAVRQAKTSNLPRVEKNMLPETNEVQNVEQNNVIISNPALVGQKASSLGIMLSIISQYRSFWLAYLGLFIGSAIAGALFPVQAVLYAHSVSSFQLSESGLYRAANFWGLMWFVVAIVVAMAYFTLSYLGAGLGETISQDYRCAYFRSFLDQDCAFFDAPDNGVGRLIAHLSAEPETIHSLAGGNLSVMITVGVCILSTVILALATGWKYALVVLAGGLPVIFGANFMRERMENTFQERSQKLFMESVAYASECVDSIRTVSSLNMVPFVVARFESILTVNCQTASHYALRAMAVFALSESIDFLCMALAFWYGGHLLVRDHYSTNQFFVVFISIVFGSQSAGSYFAHSSDISRGINAIRTIQNSQHAATLSFETASMEDDMEEQHPNSTVPIFKFKNVEFSYPARKGSKVLHDLNIELRPGQFIAFVGESGSGKSTISQLLERFYELDDGTLNIDGRTALGMGPNHLRRKFALVSQEPVLYKGTIKENLLLGVDKQPSDDEIQDILETCQLNDLINSLPDGLHTQIGKQGIALSGGQRQRIAIARALFRNSRVLFLDEATSALDSETEQLIHGQLIKRYVGEKNARRGMVAVAHRLSTVRHADVIHVMVAGRIVEKGNHEELCRQMGTYHRMWKDMQRGSV